MHEIFFVGKKRSSFSYWKFFRARVPPGVVVEAFDWRSFMKFSDFWSGKQTTKTEKMVILLNLWLAQPSVDVVFL